jgi:hypothetical protein
LIETIDEFYRISGRALPYKQVRGNSSQNIALINVFGISERVARIKSTP